MGTLAEGIKEIFATAKTTGSNVMLCGNDGTPDGHMTIANLASVLGASMQTLNNYDINSFTETENKNSWFKLIDCTHTPSNLNFCILHHFSNGGDSYQEAFSPNSDDYYFVRRRPYNGQWSDWSTISTNIPTFYKNYADIVSLTSGVKKDMRVSQKTLVVPANGSNSELGLQANPFIVIKADTSNFNGCIVLLCDHAYFMVLGNFGGFNDWVTLIASGGKLVIQNKTGVQLSLPVFTFVG